MNEIGLASDVTSTCESTIRSDHDCDVTADSVDTTHDIHVSDVIDESLHSRSSVTQVGRSSDTDEDVTATNTIDMFSVLDLEAFQHDSEVENALSGPFSDDESTVTSEPDLLLRNDDSSVSTGSTCSTCSLTSLSSDEDTHWLFKEDYQPHVRPNARSRKKRIVRKNASKRRTTTTSRKLRCKSPLSACPVDLPDFSEVAKTLQDTNPSVIQALHKSREDILTLGISAIDYYESLSLEVSALSKAVPPKAHVDGGALATTCNRLNYIWCYHELTREERKKVSRLRVADDTIHVPTGVGFLKVPCRTEPGYLFVPTFFTPEIPATILSPHAVCKTLACTGYETYSNIVDDYATMQLMDCTKCQRSLDFDLHVIKGLLYTESMIMPNEHEHLMSELPEDCPCNPQALRSPFPETHPVRALSREQSRMLWHMRLGHSNARSVSELHKYADGIPSLPRSDVLHTCHMCAQSKLHKADRQPEEDRPADVCWQHIQIDHGFIVQKSKAKSGGKARRSPTKRKRKGKPTHSQWTSSMRPLVTESRSQRPSRSTVFKGSYAPTTRTANRTARSRNSTATSTSVPPPETVYTPLDERAPISDEKWSFDRIMTHAGPLRRDDPKFRKHAFSLKIRWSNGQTTWEPLDVFLRDAQDEVIEYAKKHNLLDNDHWSDVRDAALSQSSAAPSLGEFDDDHEDADDEPVTTVPDDTDYSYEVSDRYKELKGFNDETCYVLITDRLSGAIKVAVRRDKTPPLDFLKTFIAHYSPDVQDKTVRFDGGGDLGGCAALHEIFEAAGYAVETTAPASSNEIGQAERPHRSIADAIRTMLFAAGLAYKFWPYALKYYVLIHNMLPHAGRDFSSYEICSGKRPNVSLLRVFGCRIYALPAKGRDSKLDDAARKGIFLGFKKSMRNAVYYDLESRKIKTARHVAFDEGMLDCDDPPPFARYLHDPKAEPFGDKLDLNDTTDFSIMPTAFNDIKEVECEYRPDATYPLGFQIGNDPRFLRAFATSFQRPFGKFSIPRANKDFVGCYIIKVGNFAVHSPEDVAKVLDTYSRMSSPPKTLVVRLATDKATTLSDSRPPALSLRPADIRRIAAMPLVAGEGTPAQQRAALRAHANAPVPSYTPADPDDTVLHSPDELLEMRKLSNDHMTPEERELKSFTRKNLMKLPNWEQWRDADDLQLDTHLKAGTIGHPVPRPAKDPNMPPQVYRLHWARLVKSSGVRKSRACLDGSKRAAPWLRMLVQTYSSCVDLACLRAFIALSVNRGYYICFGDVENAYQQSPPPTIDCFLEIDDTVQDWYLRTFGKKLDKFKDVLPLHRALQRLSNQREPTEPNVCAPFANKTRARPMTSFVTLIPNLCRCPLSRLSLFPHPPSAHSLTRHTLWAHCPTSHTLTSVPLHLLLHPRP